MTHQTYTRIEAYMRTCMSDSAHDVEHIYRVLYNALQIAEVVYTGSFQFSQPYRMHKFQNQYGPSEAGSYFSWGSKLATPSD